MSSLSTIFERKNILNVFTLLQCWSAYTLNEIPSISSARILHVYSRHVDNVEHYLMINCYARTTTLLSNTYVVYHIKHSEFLISLFQWLLNAYFFIWYLILHGTFPIYAKCIWISLTDTYSTRCLSEGRNQQFDWLLDGSHQTLL